jgi:hypothetical protein
LFVIGQTHHWVAPLQRMFKEPKMAKSFFWALSFKYFHMYNFIFFHIYSLHVLTYGQKFRNKKILFKKNWNKKNLFKKIYLKKFWNRKNYFKKLE